MFVGFVNLEPKGLLSFDIIDPIPLMLDETGHLQAKPGYASVGEARLAAMG